MRFISIGDLVLDYYYEDGNLLGVCGGNTSHNIIANLAHNNIPTAVFATCGCDIQGDIAIKSLNDLNVDTAHIKRLNTVRTRALHASYTKGNSQTTRICPYCGTKTWYYDSQIDIDDILSSLQETDILVFDNLNSKNQTIIDNTSNIKIIDIGYYYEFKNISDEELINKIRHKFKIINFNERVTNYLMERFNLDEFGIYCLFSPEFMSITRGEKGATFIYNNAVYNFKLTNIGNTIDSSGAGDAFISSIIRDWINNDYSFSPELFKKWYNNSCKLTSKVVSKMGARGHIHPIYKVNTTDKCSCDEISLIRSKQLTR